MHDGSSDGFARVGGRSQMCVHEKSPPHLLMYLLLLNRKTKVKPNKGSTSCNTRELMIYYYSYYYYYYDYHYNIYIFSLCIYYLFVQPTFYLCSTTQTRPMVKFAKLTQPWFISILRVLLLFMIVITQGPLITIKHHVKLWLKKIILT